MTAAFDAALVHELGRLTPLARHLCRNRIDAEDLLQDTALHALEGRDKYVDTGNFPGWVATVFRNRFRERLRYSKVRVTVPLDAAEDFMPTVQPGAEWAAMLTDAREALEGMIPMHRAVLIDDVLGSTYDELATDHGIKLGTVKSRLSRARASVRAQVDGTIRERVAA